MEMDGFVVGLIGMGDMGKLYARKLSAAGWRIHACDQRKHYESLRQEFSGDENIDILLDGHEVSRSSDYILYNVEAETIEKVVGEYAKSTKEGAIVGGQTSCKSPEIAAFEKHLSNSTEIISLHSLHGPNTEPKGQPLIIVPHRASPCNLRKVKTLLSSLDSQIALLSAIDHDYVTANTQALASTVFLTIGSALHLASQNTQQSLRNSLILGPSSELDVKAYSLVPRIYNQKWHVHAGLCLLNPFAKKLTREFSKSVENLVGQLKSQQSNEICRNLRSNAASMFSSTSIIGTLHTCSKRFPQLQFTLYVALLATVDTWSRLSIKPKDHLVASTPQYRLWISVIEQLVMQPELLEAVLDELCASDLSGREIIVAAESWAECIETKNFGDYRKRFEDTGVWFELVNGTKELIEVQAGALDSSKDTIRSQL